MYTVTSPALAAIVVYLLYADFGWSVFVGLAIGSVILGCELLTSRKYGNYRYLVKQKSELDSGPGL